jgi:hypothetical protein
VTIGLMMAAGLSLAADKDDDKPRNLPQFAFQYETRCHQAQASRLKSLPQPLSEVQKMQIEITDSDVCPCMARKIIEVSDQQLAARILNEDKDLDATFYEPAFQSCSVSVLRKIAMPSCKDDITPGTLKPAAIQAACQCYSDAVAKMTDDAIRDDAVAMYRNYEERAKDPSVKPYDSKLEAVKTACIAKQKK